ncbi:MAG: site-2 protease family protein [bacterium]|nr:site-2 protease family protein [bacterium]
MFSFSAFELISLAITFVISISLHEYAHARASTKLGDPTPKLQGRLTPNPLKHIDPIGFLLIFIIHFGRGRPVIINPAYYKHPLRDELLVSLA